MDTTNKTVRVTFHWELAFPILRSFLIPPITSVLHSLENKAILLHNALCFYFVKYFHYDRDLIYWKTTKAFFLLVKFRHPSLFLLWMVGVENSSSYEEGKDVLREACSVQKERIYGPLRRLTQKREEMQKRTSHKPEGCGGRWHHLLYSSAGAALPNSHHPVHTCLTSWNGIEVTIAGLHLRKLWSISKGGLGWCIILRIALRQQIICETGRKILLLCTEW